MNGAAEAPLVSSPGSLEVMRAGGHQKGQLRCPQSLSTARLCAEPALPPADPCVLSIYTQLVSSSAGLPGAVNGQKPGLYDHNNQLSFFCLLSPPPQALEEWLWRKGREFFYFPDQRVNLPGRSYIHCSSLLGQQVPDNT